LVPSLVLWYCVSERINPENFGQVKFVPSTDRSRAS
jgi:hypothetical protein